MIKKNILLIFLSLLFLVSGVYAQDCYFKTYDSNCERISTSKNTFQIEDISFQEIFDRYEVEIYETKSPDNKLIYQTEDLNINQITPFLEPAVYTIEVKAYDKSNNYKSKNFEYIFDNLEPMPPIVPIEFDVISNSVSILGKATANTILYVENAMNSQIAQATVSSDGVYDLPISNLAQGVNYLKFYIKGINDKKSQQVERVIVNSQGESDVNPVVSKVSINSNLASLNINTIYDSASGVYKTTKQNFYIQGVAEGATNGLVYINGIRTLSDLNGNFAGFIILNEGLNDIEVIAGDSKSNMKVEYHDLRFKFLEVDFDKVTQTTIPVSGKVNFDYNFLVIVNGEVQNTISPASNSFNFEISNLQDGKNFIELRGINAQRYDFIVYKDAQVPTTQIIENQLTKADKLIFEIKDDIGINIRDLSLKVDGIILDKGDLKVKNDFYIFDISGINSALGHSYLLAGSDLSERTFATQGNFEVDSSKTAIEDIYFDDGELIGNQLFVKKGVNRVNILPSKNIAFKSIYLDDVEQIDYEIFDNNIIKLNLNIEESEGSLRLEFMDSARNIYTKEYNYYAPSKEPQIELDYIRDARSTDYVTLSGEITGEYIDWLTLTFNNQENFIRYGNYFESIIDLTKDGIDNLNILVSDYSGNSHSQIYGSLLFKDIKTSIINLNPTNNFNNSVKGSITNQEDSLESGGGNLNFINTYDGYTFDKLYLSADSFELPLSQRTGYRSLNIKGYEKSGKRFNSNLIFKVDSNDDIDKFDEKSLAPIIYFNGNDRVIDQENYVIQGNIKSSTSIKSVTYKGSPCIFDSTSFVCKVSNLRVGDNTITIDVVDNTDKRISKDYIITRIDTSYLSSISGIQEGINVHEIIDGYYLFGDEFVTEGNIAGDDLTISLLVGGEEILYNEKTGQLNLPIDFSTEAKSLDKANLKIQIKAEDEFGNVALSDKILVLYRRVVESLTRVIVR